MRYHLSLKLLISTCLMATSIGAYAQPKGWNRQSYLPKSLQSIDFGFTSANTATTYKGTFVSTNGIRKKEEYFEGPTVSKGGLGVMLGTFRRLVLIGKQTAITADVTFHYNQMYWNIGKGYFVDDSWTISGQSKQFALPVGLSLRFGADGRLEKNHRFCFNVGGGVMPTMTNTVLPMKNSDSSDSKNKYRKAYVNPYIKIEAGLFSRICWKLRFTYAFGRMPYVVEGETIGKEGNRSVINYENIGKGSMMLSVVIMPFSYDWPDNGWWNNARTSKKMY